ncbi:hypothetical protein ACFX2I_007111 [Malus domestica]
MTQSLKQLSVASRPIHPKTQTLHFRRWPCPTFSLPSPLLQSRSLTPPNSPPPPLPIPLLSKPPPLFSH